MDNETKDEVTLVIYRHIISDKFIEKLENVIAKDGTRQNILGSLAGLYDMKVDHHNGYDRMIVKSTGDLLSAYRITKLFSNSVVIAHHNKNFLIYNEMSEYSRCDSKILEAENVNGTCKYKIKLDIELPIMNRPNVSYTYEGQCSEEDFKNLSIKIGGIADGTTI